LVVIAIIALLVAILLPALGEAKRAAKLAIEFSNLKQYGGTVNAYSSENKERAPAFSWRAGPNSSVQTNGTVQNYTSGSDVEAAAQQAADIIRRRAQPDNANFPVPTNWIPHILYSHLVVMDYLAARLPEPITRSPYDTFRARWAENPTNPASLGFTDPNDARWPYSSSYQITSPSFSPDRFTIDGGSLRQAADAQNQYQYNAGSSNLYRLGPRKIGDVQFPAGKVYAFVDHMRHKGKRTFFFTSVQAEVNLVCWDASARTVASRDMNRSGYWGPGINTFSPPVLLTYVPDELRGLNAEPVDPLDGKCRWTIGGLRGIDFGAKAPFNVPGN
jgi:type II secretory pathway pseudopilin PulG